MSNRHYIGIAIMLLIVLGLAFWLVPLQLSGAAPTDLEGKTRKLTSINGQPPVTGSKATIIFNNGKVAGSTGVNQFGGNYRASGASITLSDIASTMMASTDPALNAQEQTLLSALQGQIAYRVSGNQLELRAGATTLIYST
jgi:heat shock protein HslJ